MNVQTIYSSLTRTEAIDDYAQERILHVLQKYVDDGSVLACKARFQMENSSRKQGVDVFTCDVVVTTKRYPVVHIKKSSTNLYDAIQAVAEKLNNTMSKQHRKQIDRRHRHWSPRRSKANFLEAAREVNEAQGAA